MIYHYSKNVIIESLLQEGAKSGNWFKSEDFGLMRANYLANPMEHNIRLKIYIKNVPGYAFEFPINSSTGEIIEKKNLEANNAAHIVKYNKLKKLIQDIAIYNKNLIIEFYNGNHTIFDELDSRTIYIGSMKESRRKEIINAEIKV